jgi:hypothetical protein
MTLHDLEKILMNISIDANSVGNTQYSMVIGATINMIKSVENLSSNIYSGPFNDSCKSMMIQKMTDIDMFTSQAILMRLAEMGIDIGMYGGSDAISGGMMGGGMFGSMPMSQPMMRQSPMMQMPIMQMPQMMPQQMMMQQPVMQPQQMMQQMPQAPAPVTPPPPASPATVPPPSPPPPPRATTPAEPVSAPPPVAAASGGGTGATMGLPGAGAAPDAAGPAYLLKVINGEI